MTTTLITGIAELLTHAGADSIAEAADSATLTNAALIIAEGRIAWTGPASQAPPADDRIDIGGRAVIPGFVDSHAHLVFAGDRAQEFAARMTGTPYTAGGIRTTVAATRAADDETLRANLKRLTTEMLRQGTTTVECKSGYGLTTDDEKRALRLAREQVEAVTYLGAHVIPAEYEQNPDAYVDLVKGEMLDVCAPYADYADVFCERGAFDADQARAILTAAQAKGLDVRLHANQLGPGPGVRLAVELGAASADHCTYLDDEDIEALAGSQTVATLLPGVEFSTRSPYPDARKLIAAGATVALATDCNPGSCYTDSMPFCVALAVREMRMSPAEALWAATVGGAKALRRTDIGHLGVGARADFAVLDAPSFIHLAYRPGVPLVHRVWKSGTPAA